MAVDLQTRFLAELPVAAEMDLLRRQLAAAAGLLARWREPHRLYHNETHLLAVLAALDDLTSGAGLPLDQPVPAVDLGAVRLAAWFHDAVYQGRPGDDEEASAVLAERMLPPLGVAPEQVTEVARLVRMTAAHAPEPGDGAAELLADADLAVLGSQEPVYRSYAEAIRAEYAQVPDDAFRLGRAQVLRRLGADRWIYRTPRGRALWEDAARANLDAELRRLRV